MTALIRELAILAGACFVWSLIASPEMAKAIRSAQMIKSDSPFTDQSEIARSNFAKCFGYALCACIPFGSRIIFPFNWLVIIVVWLSVFFGSLAILRQLQRNRASDRP